MLWQAGQARVLAEQRDHLAERYVSTRDAWLSAEVMIGRAKMVRGSHVPDYATPPGPPKGLSDLVKLKGVAVDRGDQGLVN